MCQVTSTTPPKRGQYKRNKKAQPPPRGDCGSCKKSSVGLPNAAVAEYRLCSRCRAITYCSKACAAAHWAVHKADCSEDKLQRKDLYSRTKANKRRGEKTSPRAESAKSKLVNTPSRVSTTPPASKPASPTAPNGLRWARGPDAPNAVGFTSRRTAVEPVEAELVLDELWEKQEARGRRRQARDKKQAARSKRQEARAKREEAREKKRQVAIEVNDELVTPPSETRTLASENSETDGLFTPPSEVFASGASSETDGLFTPPSEITSGITSESDELVTPPELWSSEPEPEAFSSHILDVPMDETALKESMDETALRVKKPFRLDAPEFVPSVAQAPSPVMMPPPPPGSFIQWQMVVPVYVVPVPKRMRGKRRY
jgi:hypothetical protein